MNKLRIAVDARPLANSQNGIGRYTRHLLEALISAGQHDYYLYAYQTEEEMGLAPHLRGKYQVRSTHLAVPSLHTVFAQWHFLCWCKADQIDVLWSPRHHLPVFCSVPSLVTIHDLVWLKAPDTMKFWHRMTERILMPAALQRANKIIAVSKSTAADIYEYQQNLEAKTVVIYEAPTVTPKDLPVVEVGADSISGVDNFFLFVGSAEPRKNLPRLLAAFRKLLDAGLSSHRLVIVSGDSWKTSIHSQIQKLGLTERVNVHNNASDNELARFYDTCDFLVIPSLYEGFGLPVVEAMSFGKPALVGSGGALAEILGDAGIVVDAQSVSAIARGLERMIVDEEFTNQCGQIALARAKLFSWNQAAAETTELLESIGLRTPKV